MGTIAGKRGPATRRILLLISAWQIVDPLFDCDRRGSTSRAGSAGADFRLSAGRHAADSSVVSLRFRATLAFAVPVGNGVSSPQRPRRRRSGGISLRSSRTMQSVRRVRRKDDTQPRGAVPRRRRSAVAGGVRRLVGRAFRRLLSIGDMISARRVYVRTVLQFVTPRRKPSRRENGVVSDRRKGVAHRVPNSLTKNRTTVTRVQSHVTM